MSRNNASVSLPHRGMTSMGALALLLEMLLDGGKDKKKGSKKDSKTSKVVVKYHI